MQSKLFARLCVAKKKFVATIATQIGCVATLCDRRYLRDFVWPRKSLLRPLRLKMGIVRPKLFARLCVAQKNVCYDHCDKKNGYVVTLCDRSYLRDFVWPKKSFLRPLRLKMGMLQYCATEIICMTLCDPKKNCSNHCDSKWVCCDIVRLKLFARLCVAQKNFVATIATQIGYVATLCDRSYLRDFVWPKKNLLRPLRLKMGMLRHCATEVICTILCDPKKVCSNHCDSKWVCCDIVRLKLFARLCVDQKKFVATIATQNGYGMLRHCAIEVICATLCGQKKVCCDHCDSNWVCCDFVRPKIFARLCVAQKNFVATIATQNGYVATLCNRSYLRDFVWTKKSLLRPLRLKMGMVCCDIVQSKLFARLCVAQKKFFCDHCDSKWVCCNIVRSKLFARLCATQKKFVVTIATQNGYCATEVICATLCGPKKICYDHCDKKNEYVVTLCDRSYLRDFVWPKKSLLRPLRLKMGMLRHCAIEVICATLCGPKKSCCDHCDSKWVWYVATLCNRSYLRDFVWPKKSLLRPLRLKLGVLRLCATEDICATLCGPKKVCCDHCDSKWVLCDRSYLRDFVWPEKSLLRPLRQKKWVCCNIVRPKLFARLCVAQKKFFATIATQIGCVATLCDRRYLRDFVWPKKSLLRPLRFKMGIVRPKLFARLCVARKKFVTTIATKKMGMLQHCATKVICATLCGPKKVFCDHCDSKWVCCNTVRSKLFARFCATQKKFVVTIATQNGYVATLCD